MWFGGFFAFDAVVQCVGAWQNTYVCAPMRGLSVLRVLGADDATELVLTLTIAGTATIAMLVWMCCEYCCDVTCTIPPLPDFAPTRADQNRA